MRLNLKTAPAVEPITLDEAKLHLKVDGADDNTLITALIKTARQLAELETKRSFITQTWKLILDYAPPVIEIPKPPLQSIVSITVIDLDGELSVVSDTVYNVDASQNSPGRVALSSGSVWPEHRGFASFIVEFKGGYGDAATSVPDALKQGILQLLGHLYDNRGAEEIPDEMKPLFRFYKIMRI